MIRHTILALFFGVICQSTFASGLHFSPDFKIGPYWTSGISGGGVQLGIQDTLNHDAVYISYSRTSAQFFTDEDRFKTVRLGGQQPILTTTNISVQYELGGVSYEGSRHLPGRPDKSGYGVSAAMAWVFDLTPNLSLRSGMDLNYINKRHTYLGTHWSTTLNTGVVLRF